MYRTREKSSRQIFSLFTRYIVVTNAKTTRRQQCIGHVRIEHSRRRYAVHMVVSARAACKTLTFNCHEGGSRNLGGKVVFRDDEKIPGVRLSGPVELFGRLGGDACRDEKIGERQRRNDNRTQPQIPSPHPFGHGQRRRWWRLVAASGNRRPVLIIRAETAKSMSARGNRRRSAG